MINIEAITAEAAYDDGGPLVTFSSPLYQHQVQCLKRFATEPVYALLAEMGTGKTCIAINNFAILYAIGAVKKMLVIAPNGVQWNWVLNELPKHLPKQFNIKYAGYSGTMHKADKEKFEEIISPLQPFEGRILCVSWDSLSNAKGMEAIKLFLGDKPRQNMIVLDESDYAKNPETKRAKNLLSIAPLAYYRRIMTGTPITNSPFDAFVQFEFLSPYILDCKSSFVLFKQRHGVFLSRGCGLVENLRRRTGRSPMILATDKYGRPQYKNIDQLSRQIAPYSFIVKKKDCVDLPDKVYQNLYVDLTPKQRQVYDRIKNEALINMAESDFNITSKLSLLTHLCLCTGNHFSPQVIKSCYNVTFDNPAPDSAIKVDPEVNPKLKALIDIVSIAKNQGDKVLVWARFVSEINDIMQGLLSNGFNAVAYYGAINKEGREAAINAFQNGDAQVFVANQQSGGTGLTLTAGNVVVYYSNSFSLHDRLQSEDRCHRIGQTKTTIYINLLARDTVDTHIQKVLDSKQDVAKAVLAFSKDQLKSVLS